MSTNPGPHDSVKPNTATPAKPDAPLAHAGAGTKGYAKPGAPLGAATEGMPPPVPGSHQF